ncbi:HDIG domain-containing protein [Dysgonomonas sp. 216]|uniref:HDIG domain-containing metalloprotein n=1 Tax=Dysgonomonas sp. 216 TaxID=2302934 RepID=UPI0013CFB6A5|nr:HDIG domain-containing metalloprotein [Dysgonomonas sp. 216]NDW17510.1 HDIG domain-containing protein [Dysgonomonas sp. 216]
MNAIEIIHKYYAQDTQLYNILITHSTLVTNKALNIARNHPELNIDEQFVSEAAMLHDIGIFMTNAPAIFCFGDFPYIAHGYLGRELLDKEGFHRHGLVCERHTGAGLTKEEIIEQQLPIPHRNMFPVSIEEQVICFADCFFSKTHLDTEKDVDKIIKGMNKFGERSANQFIDWCNMFL